MMTPRSLADEVGLGDPLRAQPQHVEGADQVDVDDLAEGRQREDTVFAQHPDGVAGAGAVDDDAQRTQRLGEVEGGGDAVFVADVGRREPRALTELADHVLAFEVEHHHLRTGVEQPTGGRQSQPGRATGDERSRVFDLHSRCFLSIRTGLRARSVQRSAGTIASR